MGFKFYYLVSTTGLRAGSDSDCDASSEGGEDGLHLDTADTGAVNDGDVDVARNTPGAAPGVADDVVGLAGGISTVADGNDTVVKVGAAGLGVEDTTRVELEDEGVGLDGNGDWAVSDGGLEGLGAVGGNSVAASGGHDDLALAVSAVLVVGDIGVIGLLLHAVVVGVLEGSAHVTTVATEVSVLTAGAIDELLLGQLVELTVLDLVSALHGTNGGEGPAGAALALVLDGVHGALGPPVDGGGDGNRLEGGLSGGLVHGLVGKDALELFGCPVGELVDANAEGVVVLGVLLSELGEGVHELLGSHLELLFGSVALAILGDELEELHLVGREGGVERSALGLVAEGVHGDAGGNADHSEGSESSSHLLVKFVY